MKMINLAYMEKLGYQNPLSLKGLLHVYKHSYVDITLILQIKMF